MQLTVDPHSLVITSGQVEETADGQGWAIQLTVLLAGYGPCHVRLAEDGATFYPGSLTEAQRLIALLDAVVRTTAASENINSILKPMLWVHRHFANRQAAQRWLNLFILRHNMRRFLCDV
jgi:hypothetical protein